MLNLSTRRAFTLIELLVVITIIVILLALLTPALDKAIYMADLAVCGARLKSIGLGTVQYTAAHKQSYPYRKVIEQNSGQPDRLITSWNLGGFDDRDMLDGYIARKTYMDPMCKMINIDALNPNFGDNLFVGYSIWFDFWYSGDAAHCAPMKKLGQRFKWQPHLDAMNEVYNFGLNASDLDQARGSGLTWTNHPDDAGILQQVVREGADYVVQGTGIEGRQFSTWWEDSAGRRRGGVDLNYAYDDGSVLRLDRVGWTEWDQYDRIVRVPEHSGVTVGETPDWHQLPRP